MGKTLFRKGLVRMRSKIEKNTIFGSAFVGIRGK